MTTPAAHIAPLDLPAFRGTVGTGDIVGQVRFLDGFSLHASPALAVGGSWRSPAGRLLELDVILHGSAPDDWIGLHMRLPGTENLAGDLAGDQTGDQTGAWIGFACRSGAPEQVMIRPCLRSGTDDGFGDCFFDKHILAGPESRNHVDALNLATTRVIPEHAPWRELVLFLPRTTFRWDLHDLRVFRL